MKPLRSIGATLIAILLGVETGGAARLEDLETSHRHFEDGCALARQGDYRGAIAAFRRSLLVAPRSHRRAIVFNLGSAHLELSRREPRPADAVRDLEHAAEWYRQYLAIGARDDKDRDDVRQWLADVERECRTHRDEAKLPATRCNPPRLRKTAVKVASAVPAGGAAMPVPAMPGSRIAPAVEPSPGQSPAVPALVEVAPAPVAPAPPEAKAPAGAAAPRVLEPSAATPTAGRVPAPASIIPSRRLRIAIAVILGGTVSAAVGAGLLGYAKSIRDSLPSDRTWSEPYTFADIFDRGTNYFMSGGIVLTVGAIATLLGVGLLFGDPAWFNGSQQASLWVAPSLSGFAIGGRF